MDNKYRIVGTVSIPDDKKKELVEHILTILYKCGLRKTEIMNINGKEVKVLTIPAPDKDGIICFDYSIFEMKERKFSTFDTNTFELVTPDRGYNEYGLAMNVIMLLLEAYSETKCYMLCDSKPFYVSRYAELIKGLLGIDIKFTHRLEIGDDFAKNGHSDVPKFIRIEALVEEWETMEFYKAILRDDQDEFLEFWKDERLVLSEKMKQRICMWKDAMEKEKIPLDCRMDNLLYGVIYDLYKTQKCRYVDKQFVEEFLQHEEDENYMKALLVLREMLDEYVYLFPELTKQQAIDWIIRDGRDKHDYLVMSAFQSLLVNQKKREELFGF